MREILEIWFRSKGEENVVNFHKSVLYVKEDNHVMMAAEPQTEYGEDQV